jgi:hypothetical protein
VLSLGFLGSSPIKLSDLGKDAPVAGRSWCEPSADMRTYISEGDFILCTVRLSALLA